MRTQRFVGMAALLCSLFGPVIAAEGEPPALGPSPVVERDPASTDVAVWDDPFYRECVLKHLEKARTRAALDVLLAICRKETE